MPDQISRLAPTVAKLAPSRERNDRRSDTVERHSWSKTRSKVDLESVRNAAAAPPRLPRLADRTERFLAEIRRGAAEEASKALNELVMMVTANAIHRGKPAAEILKPIAAGIIRQWSADQRRLDHGKLLELRGSIPGGKTREAIVTVFLDLLADEFCAAVVREAVGSEPVSSPLTTADCLTSSPPPAAAHWRGIPRPCR